MVCSIYSLSDIPNIIILPLYQDNLLFKDGRQISCKHIVYTIELTIKIEMPERVLQMLLNFGNHPKKKHRRNSDLKKMLEQY